MIMTLEAGDKLMSLADLSVMLDIPVHTLYRWRHRGDGPVGERRQAVVETVHGLDTSPTAEIR